MYLLPNFIYITNENITILLQNKSRMSTINRNYDFNIKINNSCEGHLLTTRNIYLP